MHQTSCSAGFPTPLHVSCFWEVMCYCWHWMSAALLVWWTDAEAYLAFPDRLSLPSRGWALLGCCTWVCSAGSHCCLDSIRRHLLQQVRSGQCYGLCMACDGAGSPCLQGCSCSQASVVMGCVRWIGSADQVHLCIRL